MAYVTGATFPSALLTYLQEMGLPNHISSFKLECAGALDPVIIECTLYAHSKDDISENLDYMIQSTKKYKLIEVTE